jgi:hypothetical protein
MESKVFVALLLVSLSLPGLFVEKVLETAILRKLVLEIHQPVHQILDWKLQFAGLQLENVILKNCALEMEVE